MDLHHDMGGDLDLGATGDLRSVDGSLHGQQRVLRRLLTNPGGYIWHMGYGGGLPAFVGQVVDTGRITAVIQAQMFRERAVAQLPPPDVGVIQGYGTGVVTATIRYVDARGGEPVSVQLGIAP